MKIAIILFNLGGPDVPESVQPFLFNLFNDKAIIGAPNPVRFLLARFISSRRAPVAQEIYANLGGGSPLLSLTESQASALSLALGDQEHEYKPFICMRYWHPMTEDVVREVKSYNPDKVILLPLYPQFSTTTTGSSVQQWQRVAEKEDFSCPTVTVCCYPTAHDFLQSHANLIAEQLKQQATEEKAPRILFSAHGLPKKVVAKGDPYQWQVEQTAKGVMDVMAKQGITHDDWRVCYQSKVGPLPWIGPSTDDEIIEAGKENKALMVVPIAFVSEHSETLVELDIEYKELADEHGVPHYTRIPALGVEQAYIQSMAAACRAAVSWDDNMTAPYTDQSEPVRLCPTSWKCCPCSS